MYRSSVPTWLAFAVAAVAPVTAGAETNTGDIPQGPAAIRSRLVVPTALNAFTARAPAAQISPTIYLERCRSGCAVNGTNVNDARAMSSTIPQPRAEPYTIDEYRNGAGATGAAADAEWNLLVQCMREVYSPFNVVVTDVKPAGGVSYHAAIIAGIPQNINFDNSILGVAPLAGDCSPQDNVISFSFANAHTQTETVSRVNNLCWTAAQESAHAFGLDHQFSFIADNRSACSDPMTYRFDCGGQKFYRNDNANCGEDKVRQCRCGASQNSHLKLLSVFGAGVSLIPPPTAAITTPMPGTQTLSTFVGGTAGSKRGVAKVELYLNDFKWGESKGVVFGQNGQANPGAYSVKVPADVPNSIIDVRLRAYDDLGNYGDSPVVTVTKGAPCETADTCATGQKCESGRCFWDPPIGELGADCTYPQYCTSNICSGTAEKQICTQGCIPGVADSCPDGFECYPQGAMGVCFFPEDGGCCSVASAHRVPWLQIGASAVMLGLLVRRRRRC